ncbi:MAG TPA: hypothetical protein VKZ59_11665 [Acidobacteriota bacterium]|nr:hypothetical protein [Acidobacteriota bacterium]
MKRMALISTFFLIFAFVPALLAQEAGAQQQEEATQSFQGELVSVDSLSQKLTVRDAEGTEMEFSYTDETEVIGAEEGVAGLATKSGSQVSVSYTDDGQSKTATQIQVMQQ